MYRIDSADSVDGRFDAGDEALGREGTVVTDEFMNAVQEEILAPIEHAGLAPDKGDSTQLLQALLAIVAPALPRTGEFALDLNPTPRPGWVFFDDGTLGPAGSGATTRADNDTKALYFVLWDNYSNNWLPVSGAGRGASAQADWDAGKTIRLPRLVGRALALAGNGAGLTYRNRGEYDGRESNTPSVTVSPYGWGSEQTGAGTGPALNNPTANGRLVTGSGRNEASESLESLAHATVSKAAYGSPQSNIPPTGYVLARVKL